MTTPSTSGPLPKEPRIYTRCPACHNDTLTINEGHLLCTWHVCPNPTLIHTMGERAPAPSSDTSSGAVADQAITGMLQGVTQMLRSGEIAGDWRMLEVGEVIQEGDEWLAHSEQWCPATDYNSIGLKLQQNAKPFRRRVAIDTTESAPAALELVSDSYKLEALARENNRLSTELDQILKFIREAVGSDGLEGCAPAEAVALIISQRDNAYNEVSALTRAVGTLQGEAQDFRDCVLNGRHELEAPCLDNDQTNAVLSAFDRIFTAANQPTKGEK